MKVYLKYLCILLVTAIVLGTIVIVNSCEEKPEKVADAKVVELVLTDWNREMSYVRSHYMGNNLYEVNSINSNKFTSNSSDNSSDKKDYIQDLPYLMSSNNIFNLLGVEKEDIKEFKTYSGNNSDSGYNDATSDYVKDRQKILYGIGYYLGDNFKVDRVELNKWYKIYRQNTYMTITFDQHKIELILVHSSEPEENNVITCDEVDRIAFYYSNYELTKVTCSDFSRIYSDGNETNYEKWVYEEVMVSSDRTQRAFDQVISVEETYDSIWLVDTTVKIFSEYQGIYYIGEVPVSEYVSSIKQSQFSVPTIQQLRDMNCVVFGV